MGGKPVDNNIVPTTRGKAPVQKGIEKTRRSALIVMLDKALEHFRLANQYLDQVRKEFDEKKAKYK